MADDAFKQFYLPDLGAGDGTTSANSDLFTSSGLTNIQTVGGNNVLFRGLFQSANYKPNTNGWSLSSEGIFDYNNVHNGTIANFTLAPTSTTPVVTDVLVPHLLGKIPSLMQINATITASGTTTSQYASGISYYNNSATLAGGFVVTYYFIGSPVIAFNTFGQLGATGIGGITNTSTISIAAVDSVNFTVRFSSYSNLASGTTGDFTNITWIAYG